MHNRSVQGESLVGISRIVRFFLGKNTGFKNILCTNLVDRGLIVLKHKIIWRQMRNKVIHEQRTLLI